MTALLLLVFLFGLWVYAASGGPYGIGSRNEQNSLRRLKGRQHWLWNYFSKYFSKIIQPQLYTSDQCAMTAELQEFCFFFCRYFPPDLMINRNKTSKKVDWVYIKGSRRSNRIQCTIYMQNKWQISIRVPVTCAQTSSRCRNVVVNVNTPLFLPYGVNLLQITAEDRHRLPWSAVYRPDPRNITCTFL